MPHHSFCLTSLFICCQSDAGGESTLDIQTIMGVAPRVQHFFWSVGGPGPAKPPGQGAYILEWAKEVSDMDNPPLITSHSYGDTEQGALHLYSDVWVG